MVRDMEEAGVLVFAGGLVEDMEKAFSADATSGTMVVTDGPYTETTEYLGGITIIEVSDLETAKTGDPGPDRRAIVHVGAL